MPDTQVLFVASGSAIKPGIALGSVSNLQVAPTIAKILGVQLPDAKQPVLKDPSLAPQEKTTANNHPELRC
jgi:hypothetical protein